MEVYATVKGQIVIPAELRRKYGIKEGTKIVVTEPKVALICAKYAECFTAALAKLRDGEVVTGDQEFKHLENEIKIEWLA